MLMWQGKVGKLQKEQSAINSFYVKNKYSHLSLPEDSFK